MREASVDCNAPMKAFSQKKVERLAALWRYQILGTPALALGSLHRESPLDTPIGREREVGNKLCRALCEGALVK